MVQSSLSAVWLRDRMSRKRKRVLDDRHAESVRSLIARAELRSSARRASNRSKWSRSDWKAYNDRMGGLQ